MSVQCVACKQYVDRHEAHKRTVEIRPEDPEAVKEWFICCGCYPEDEHLHTDDEESAYPN